MSSSRYIVVHGWSFWHFIISTVFHLGGFRRQRGLPHSTSSLYTHLCYLVFTHLISLHTLSLPIMDFVQDFAREHVAQISATIALVTYAVSRNKLTPAGVLSGVVVAIIHMLHPWQAFFWLLMVFFLLGTLVTKVRT